MSDQTIHNQVDLILFEEGKFSVLNWFLREGYVEYNDYQNWRKGEILYLEDHFKIMIQAIIADLEIVQRYAGKLKLDSFHRTYTSVSDQIIHFCRSPANEIIFTTDYEPARNRVQMDLFFDSAPACTATDLIRAIIDKREDDALRYLSQLKSLAPESHQKFASLLTLQDELTLSECTSDRKIKLLLQTVTPLAFETLGQFAHDFLTPLWQMLSAEVADWCFDAEAPENHLSFTAFKGFQWGQVLTAVTRETDWSKEPVLLFRYGEACFKLNKELEGLETWFRLFLTASDTASTLVESTGNRLLLDDWRQFNELDPDLEPVFFPAWVVLKKPALSKHPFTIDCAGAGNTSLQSIYCLVGSKETGLNETHIKLRAGLQQQNPELFIHYMAAYS